LRVVLLLPPFNLRSARLTRASDCKGTIFATPSGATPSASFDGLKKNMAQFATLSLPHPTPHLTRSMEKVGNHPTTDTLIALRLMLPAVTAVTEDMLPAVTAVTEDEGLTMK
jgi:hypothetical protein